MLELSPEEEVAVADPLQVVVAEAVVVGEEEAVEAVVEAVGVGALPQPLAPLHMAMEDQTGASRAIPPLSSKGTDPKASNS